MTSVRDLDVVLHQELIFSATLLLFMRLSVAGLTTAVPSMLVPVWVHCTVAHLKLMFPAAARLAGGFQN